jgi:HTH-type transcriptional regulator/antitoxin HigA
VVDREPLRTMEDYERALKEIEAYFKNAPVTGTEAAARFELLAAMIRDFEDIHFPIDNSPPDDPTP